jgi:hypothetical protein
MESQLHLLDQPEQAAAPEPGDLRPASWRLSPTAREVGRRGVADARAALRAAKQAAHREDHADQAHAA